MVARAFLRELFFASPRRSFVTTGPHNHFAARIVRLWAKLRGRDDPPGTIGLDVERAVIVVAARGRKWPANPFGAGPAQRFPLPRSVFRTRLKPFAREQQNYGMAKLIKIEILEVN